jgi:hypothetical protein
MQSDSKIIITFSSKVTFSDDTACSLTYTTTISSSPDGCTVDSSTNKITITNPFGTSSYTSGSTMTFTLSTQGTNPDAAQDTGSF